MDEKIREHLKVAKAAAATLADDGDAEERLTTSVRSALEEIAKSEGPLTPEQRAVLTTLAGMDVLKADMVVRVVIRNDPWQVETKEMEVPIGSSRTVTPKMFPDTTVGITVPGVTTKAAEKPEEATRWPLDMAAAKFDPETGAYQPGKRLWDDGAKL
jgi:hypothetical protein